jgi:predicted DNA-binding transcriptional regulator AlpA
MARHTIGIDDLKSLGVPFSRPVIDAMVSCDSFPAPINNRYARVPIWNKATVESWVARNLKAKH